MTVLRAISLFSNCGAGDIGYRDAGFRFDVMAEIDKRRLDLALLNHRTAEGVEGNLVSTWPTVVEKYRARAGIERPALLCACPPCQGLSSARGRRGKMKNAAWKDARNLLILPIADVARELRPRMIVVENVPAFLTRVVRHPHTRVVASAASLLTSMLANEYVAFPFLADLWEYGVPQTRKRAFLTFIHRDERALLFLAAHDLAPFPKPARTTPIAVRDALQALGLPELDARNDAEARDPDQPLHHVPVWRDRRYNMVAAIPPNTGRTAWENDVCEHGHVVTTGPSAALCPRRGCGGLLLRPVKKARNGRWRLIRGFVTSSYKRMDPDAPAPTITTASGHLGSHTTIHPWANRLLSPLECAALQTFPSTFDWGDALKAHGSGFIRDTIGEAVPPEFTRLHGNVLAALMQNVVPAGLLRRADARCVYADTRLEGKSSEEACRERDRARREQLGLQTVPCPQ